MTEKEKTSMKIVLLGDSGVGKTSLVNRWMTGSHKTTIKPTIGANHHRKSVPVGDEEVDLFLWDTAGQEQYQALAPLYTRSACATIIVSAINDSSSLDNLPSWIQLVKDSCEIPPPMILAVNKIDLQSDYVTSTDEIEQKNDELFNGVFFVSAATGECVENVFAQAIKSGYQYLKDSGKISVSEISNLNDKSGSKGCC